MKLFNRSFLTPSKATLSIVAAVGVLGVAAQSSLASIIAVVPSIVVFTPASVVLDATQSNVDIIGFDEKQCFQLPSNVVTDQGGIAAGTLVSCHFFHADPLPGAALVLTGKARFDENILGVISSTALLYDSDLECGLTTVTYPPTGAEANRGLEGFQPNDRYQVINGGRGIQIQMDVPSFSDQVRVITECCPEGQVCD